MRIKQLALISAILIAQACDSPNKYEYTTPDAQPDMPQCAPLTECPVGACGQVDDQCGSSLSCGPCACQNGQPTNPTCGPCDLGLTLCDDQGGTCLLPALPNLSELSCDAILYINKDVENSAEDGSLQNPFLSINKAIEVASIKGAPLTLIILGAQTYEETVILSEGISLIGGFDLEGKPDPTQQPTITGQANEDTPALIGVDAQNITQPTLLANLQILTIDATAPGQHNYGLRAVKASGLTIANVKIQAGAAAHGEDGLRGEDGEDGQDGQPGAPGAYTYAASERGDIEEMGTPAQPSNNGGTSSCGTTGGHGGAGNLKQQNTDQRPQRGEAAESTAPGGAGASDATTSYNGQNGQDGAPIIPNTDHGRGGVPQNISISLDNHLTLIDGDGQDGKAGLPGHGGGGGGGSWGDVETFTINGVAVKRYQQGNQGGGGGAGGCGGQGGKHGAQGGSSLGLLLVQSPNLKLITATLAGGRAGNGGAGAAGGAPGEGGSGAAGAKQLCIAEQSCTMTRHEGGRGGEGGPGQSGAHGGAGAGGVSLGALCWQAKPSTQNTTFISGQPGQGGTSPNPTSQGQSGFKLNEQGCT